MSEINCRLKLNYDSEKEAMMIRDSIAPDTDGYVKLKLDDSTLVCEAEGEPLQLLHTVDDLLTCVAVAEKI